MACALPEVGVLALVPDRFGRTWMSRHHILTRLARYYEVLWLEPPRHWTEPLRPHGGQATDASGDMRVYDASRWLPRFQRPQWLGASTDRARLTLARRQLIARGCQRIVLHVWRPRFDRAIDRVAHDLVVYHVVDEYSFSEVDLETPESELHLLKRADQVIVHSRGLLEKKGNTNPHTCVIPNGVDFEAAVTPTALPVDIASIKRPIIGYAGMLKKQLDWKLIADLADAHPAWSFVFVGDVSPQPEMTTILPGLHRRGNVHFLGPKSSTELLRYPQHFDVCIMPYRMTDYAQYIYPLKLHEYLACGKPVVGSPIRTLNDFSHVIWLASSPEEWSLALSRSLQPSAIRGEQVAARREVAQRHSWDQIAYEVARTMAERLGGEIAARFQHIPAPHRAVRVPDLSAVNAASCGW